MMAAADAPARLLPTTDRLLRGVLHELAAIDAHDRPDIEHALAMTRTVLSHLIARESGAMLAELAELDREIVSLAQSRGLAIDIQPGVAAYDEAVARLTLGMERLRELVGTTCANSDSALFRDIERLEGRFFGMLVPAAAGYVAPTVPHMTAAAFERYLLAKFPGAYRKVSGFRKLVGGFQKDTILVDVEQADGETVTLVIRAEKEDRFVRFTASAITDEHAIVRLLWQRGIPVAEPLWVEADESLLGHRFMVSRRVQGVNTGSAYGDSAQFPAELTESFVETLARIHTVPIDDELAATELAQWLPYGTLAENTRAEIAAWRHQIWLQPPPASPSFARVFDWLEANVPQDEGPVCLLHNDYGPHNILVNENRVAAVLDWEIARIGDPAADMSFFLQCAGGAIDRQQAIARYEALTGHHIDGFRLAYFDVLSIGKVLVSTLSAAVMFQATEPALIDWMQMPLISHGAYQPLVESRIAAAEAARAI